MDLFIVDIFGSSIPAASFSVSIHDGSITGQILGISSVKTVGPMPPQSPTHFEFPSSVPLLPGATYVLDLTVDGLGWEVLYSGESPYEGGRAVVGTPIDSADL